MKATDKAVIIIGAGLAGLSCARRLAAAEIPFIILEADQRIGGRLKTDQVDGFLLNHGFQVLQTAYPEARSVLDFKRLELKPFAPGAIIRAEGKFHKIADPSRHPRDLLSTLTAPIGTLGDRLRMARLAFNVRRGSSGGIFKKPDMPTIDFLRSNGFSKRIIDRFFKPFFTGVCLDPDIKASSRVFNYIFRIFAEGDVALPEQGMGAIPEQLAENLPEGSIRTGTRVESVHHGRVELTSGQTIKGQAAVLATEGPETARLAGLPVSNGSRGEICLYFGTRDSPINEPYLILNGDGTGWVNSLTIPSIVAPTYSPAGQQLISVVVIGHMEADDKSVEDKVRKELIGWFGEAVAGWRHLKTYRIVHALPDQSPPMPDPTAAALPIRPGLFVCGEHGSVPGIQWAMLSGRHAAEAVLNELGR